MEYDRYRCLRVDVESGVAWVTIDHPPINLFDAALMGDMAALGPQLEKDPAVKVAVFQSANPDFFIAHADVELIQQLPDEAPPKSSELSIFHQIVERFRTMPKVTIGKIEGRARGGGSEFLLSLDMRFAAVGRAVFSQPEVAVGIIPGGSGTQRLPRIMGRGRALEIVLGCNDFDAEMAERYGWVNRALSPEALSPFVEELALRIASFPEQAIALAKAAVDAAELPLREGLLEEAHLFNQAAATPAARDRMAAFLADGGQTPEVELHLDAFVERLAGIDPTQD